MNLNLKKKTYGAAMVQLVKVFLDKALSPEHLAP